MNLDLQKLRKIAEAATPGERKVVNHGTTISVNPTVQMDDGTEYPAMDWIIGHMQVSNCPNFFNDAKFIAAFNRKVALAILDRIEKLEKVVTEARTMRRYCLGNDASTENMLKRFDSALKELDGEK